ncbi:TPA: hypothetical protein N0F65_001889 [Lagenidium giganteum]|uniref:PDZ domain-containing protein n=1 Tax=Lagenidium giganteum TaxID=4803 RepID=A0AAV2YX73_9STRA|nr:TPA: hypothetical protein N0F65_001889 [Lagenidium giganteum]
MVVLLIRASQVAFPPTGELGIGIKVEKDGLVVVNQIKTVKGYAELTGVALSPGDILVAVDRRPVVDQPFSEVMRLLQETKATRPTQLDFLHVDAYVSADDAVDQWLQYRHNKYPTEGEFDVYFAPYQLTGIRLVESYLMTNPLKLAHVDNAIYASLQQSDHALVDRLLNKVIVRIGTHSVLGAPVPEVTALLYDPATFPKDIWLASADDLKEDYHVLRLTEEAQLIWFCFVPEELMMEVPAVSYAACSRDSNEDLHSAVTG